MVKIPRVFNKLRTLKENLLQAHHESYLYSIECHNSVLPSTHFSLKSRIAVSQNKTNRL